MDRQPYIYTLPEQFMKDPTVPMHWKLYAIINGFWVSAKPVFASNKFFADKLGCSERYIRDCLEKLEKLGVVNREGQSQNRKIVPGVEQGGTNSSGQGGITGSVREEPTVPHISDSISDNKIQIARVNREGEEITEKSRTPSNLTGFIDFWDRYPKKENKISAQAVWRKLDNQGRFDAMNDVRSREWPEYRFIPMAHKYLEGRRWEDEVSKPKEEEIMRFGSRK